MHLTTKEEVEVLEKKEIENLEKKLTSTKKEKNLKRQDNLYT